MNKGLEIAQEPILSFSERSGVPVYATFYQLADDYNCSHTTIKKIAKKENIQTVKFHGDGRYFIQVDAFRQAAEDKYKCVKKEGSKTFRRMQQRAARMARYEGRHAVEAVSVAPDPPVSQADTQAVTAFVLSPKCQNACRTCETLPQCIVIFGAADMARKLSEEIAKEVGHK